MDENLSIVHNQLRLLLLIFAAIAIIVGFRKFGMKLFQTTLLMALLSPFLIAFVQELPLWVVIPGLLIVISMSFKKIVGKEAWGVLFGGILYDILWKLPLRLLCAAGRGAKRLFRQIFHKNPLLLFACLLSKEFIQF